MARDRNSLRQFLVRHYTLDGLKTLCFNLFVDFDNIYLGLQREDPTAAEQFATDPGQWLRWLQEKLPLDYLGDSAGATRRKILFRRCYLNPSQFGRFRPYFTRSAFEVVDCPPLTSGGKTSADIQMVMDILDALGHATHKM